MTEHDPHPQRSNLLSASHAGAACAKAADLFVRVSDLGVAMNEWMTSMYHRRPMLDPNLERMRRPVMLAFPMGC